MPIANDKDFERAVQEFQRLRDAPDASPEGQRRLEIDAEIRAYTLQQGDSMRKAKPEH
ncbi:MAG TPA: hypothetical protein VEB20_18325 [Azospirillaceae bacterium]|nr:hypothetical protein [Azospirillaceae bacterium]